MKPVIGLGAGGHARVLIEILSVGGEYEIVGLLDPDRSLWNERVEGIRVIGDDDLLPRLRSEGISDAFIGLGSVRDTGPRRRLYELATGCGFRIVDVIHPSALISPSAKRGSAFTALAGAIVGAGAILGSNVLLNTGVIIEHGCAIEDHVHVATGARLAGGVRVRAGAHIGIGAIVRQNITIGNGSLVGAGAVVVADVPDGTTVFGVPARQVDGSAGIRMAD